MRWVWRALACSGIHLALAAAVSAQVGTETSISGVVTDSSGAVVPGASIAAVQLETGLVRTAESDSRGSFAIWALPIGPYEITVAANGFTTWKAERIVLTVGERRRLFPRLNISKVTQEVTVVGGAAESLQTDNSAVQTVVQMQQIRELPLRTRNPVALVGLVPGMRFLSSDSGAERNAYVQGLGARSNATGFQIDGANANSGMDEGAMGVSNVETIAEFSVQTSSFDASSGRSPIQVVMASRSGTNDIHGTVWEFFQDDALNA
ncbi:MAG: carboxypeptidase regulatory-like domain-containing protein, partial [Vicinamibacteraceae bacterium]